MKYEQCDAFTRSYLECALWASTDDDGEPLDQNYSLSDLSPDAIQAAVQDCLQFQQENESDLLEYPSRGDYSGDEMAGFNFWLTRNHHGTGFWDREYLPEEMAQRLTEASHKFGESDLYVCDDGLLYFFP